MPTILNVDDNEMNRRLIVRIVAMRPHLTLLEAATGQEGLRLATGHRPELILLDKNLPDLHGSEVLAALKADPSLREIPVIILTAEDSRDAAARLLAAGAADYVVKPIDVPHLLALLDEYLSAGGK